jgi:hypothetical protein
MGRTVPSFRIVAIAMEGFLTENPLLRRKYDKPLPS